MSQAAEDLILSRNESQVLQSTLRQLAAELIGAGVRPETAGL